MRPLFQKSFVAAAAILVAADQYTKWLSHKLIPPGGQVNVLSFFGFVNVINRGAAFGSLQNLGNIPFMILAGIAIIIVLAIAYRDRENRVGLVLILSGAAGNLIDRAMLAHVRDFIDLHAGSHHWPAFNLADSYLTIGVILILAKEVFKEKNHS
ncbi:MAG: signal peptidase II [Actinomycetota bacterium]|nr:signal peptidase II [Actinomycetota bacterium]